MSDNKKLFRIKWTESALFTGGEVFTYIEFRAATSAEDLLKDWPGTDIMIREATVEETEAYVAGYEDGYDVATVKYRLEALDLSESEPLDWERLKKKFEENGENDDI